MNSPYTQRGLSLVELMIGITIGLIVLLAVTSLYVTTVRGSSDTLRIARLNQDLRTVVELMRNDIRRAGYWANATSDLDSSSNNNPFMAAGADVDASTAGCILFTYDSQGDSTLDDGSSSTVNDRFGFKHNATDGTVETRTGGTGSLSCSGGNWEAMTDPNLVEITALTFTLTTSNISLTSGNSIDKRDVVINITGRLRNDTAVTRSLSETVRIRNDKFN